MWQYAIMAAAEVAKTPMPSDQVTVALGPVTVGGLNAPAYPFGTPGASFSAATGIPQGFIYAGLALVVVLAVLKKKKG